MYARGEKSCSDGGISWQKIYVTENAQSAPIMHLSWIIHRFWATYRKVLDKNRLDLMASRLRIRQSNRKREIETRSHLSR